MPTTTPTDEEVRAEWLMARTKGLGGTDIAQIAVSEAPEENRVGCYKGSILGIWAVKSVDGNAPHVSPLDLQKDSKVTKRGHDMEEFIAQAYRTEFDVEADAISPGMVWHEDHPVVFGNADRVFLNPPRGLECKSRRRQAGWGPSGGDIVPLDVEIQCRVYMEVYGIHRWDIAIAFGLDDFRFYTLQRDPEFGARIIAMAEAWWETFVVGAVPPEPGWGEECRWVLERLHRDPRPVLRPPADGERVLHKKLVMARKVYKAAERQRNELSNKLRKRIGDDAGIKDLATWHRVQRKPKFNEARFKKEHPDLYKRYCEEVEPHRRLQILGEN